MSYISSRSDFASWAAKASGHTHLARALMLQGTASSAGKSFLVAGLCRLFTRRGYSVVPFKSQNMSLNSWVTDLGEEMGIAQAIQARACGLLPDSRMNPVLLKPIGEMGSQVILRGKPLATMQYSEYIQIKRRLWGEIEKAYTELSRNADIVIIEGAGSPAEINLVRHDIVNMSVARMANASVLLVADIDRGGAFAALAGTMLLLANENRQRIKGFILNRFRGDKSLLEPAMQELRSMFHTPFMGVVPMLECLTLPEEDSVSLEEMPDRVRPGCLDVAVIQLPAMSNIGDWDALALEAGVSVRLVRNSAQFGAPDLVILPGSRNVANSLLHLEKSGLRDCLLNYAQNLEKRSRGNLVGICAGLMLLGKQLNDSLGMERRGIHQGLDLLPFASSLHETKILSRKRGMINLGDGQFECAGYEIHHGRIEPFPDLKPVASGGVGEVLGYGQAGKPCRIWGTWLHGIFDCDAFRHAFLERLRREACLPFQKGRAYSRDGDLDRIADVLEASLDMGKLLALLT